MKNEMPLSTVNGRQSTKKIRVIPRPSSLAPCPFLVSTDAQMARERR